MTPCPSCHVAVNVPPLDRLCERLTPLEAAVLRTAWAGRGLPVTSDKLFDAMYADDPDGGPSASRMYAAFNGALKGLAMKLTGTGVAVSRTGYRKGVRLTIGG